MRRWTRLPDRKRLYRASPGIPFLVRVFQSRSGVSIVIGLENGVSATFAVNTSFANDQVRSTVVGTMAWSADASAIGAPECAELQFLLPSI